MSTNSCQESSLSTTASVIVIITFAYTLLASIFVYRQWSMAVNTRFAERRDADSAIRALVLLNSQMHDFANFAGNGFLADLLKSCDDITRELLKELDKSKKVETNPSTWKRIKSSFQSELSLGDIKELELRTARFRERLVFHIAMNLRSVIYQQIFFLSFVTPMLINNLSDWNCQIVLKS